MSNHVFAGKWINSVKPALCFLSGGSAGWNSRQQHQLWLSSAHMQYVLTMLEIAHLMMQQPLSINQHANNPALFTINAVFCISVCAEKAEVCLFQGVTILGPGQSLVQYFEGELCYTVQCLRNKDPETGFYAMEITSVNCSQKCGTVNTNANLHFSDFIKTHKCNICLLFCCVFFSTRFTHHPQILRFAAAPVKMCPALTPTTTGRLSFSPWDQREQVLGAHLFQCCWLCLCMQAGSSWVENCTRYDCVETSVGAVILASGVICPPFNDTDCIQVRTSKQTSCLNQNKNSWKVLINISMYYF